MRDPDRIIRMLYLLDEVWSNNPDLRLCQLISTLAYPKNDVFYVEDDVIEEALENWIRNNGYVNNGE